MGDPCGHPAPRAARGLRTPGRGWEAVDLAVGGVLVEGGAGPGRDKRGPPMSPRCRGRAISRRNSSEVKSRIPKPAARRRAKYPRRPRHGTSKRARHRAQPRQARPSRVVEGAGDAGFHVGTVPPGRYAARRRAKYPRRPRRGTSKRARRRARPRQARPSRVVEGVGDAGFHVGTVPPGRYAVRRRAKYPRRPRRGTSKQGPAQGPAATSAALPCGRGCRGRGISRRNSSEVKSRIPKPTAGAWPNYAAHKKIKRESACVGGGGGGGGADVPGDPTPARNAVGRLTAWARAGARDARPYQCRGIPLCATPGPLCARANQRGRSVRTSRAEGGADTSHAGGAFMCGTYRNTKPKRLGNASVWC